MDWRMIFLAVAFIIGVRAQNQGPVFLLEPPAHLTFSNTTGSQVSCSAHGSPTPQVDWLLQDGQTVTAVPGLRQSLGNGTLYFPPFRAEDYRKDVHSTVYRCRASNAAGTILSREVVVQAVVNQHYEVAVYHTHVSAGNTAVLGCVIPAFVKEHVTVTSWSRDESILLPGSNMGGRIVVTYGTGELHIRSARAEDGLSKYSCLTLHSLTQERKRSAPAILTVTDPTRSTAPRLAPTIQATVSAEGETDIHLTCSAQGNPPPIFSWFREINGQLQPVHSSSRYEPSQDILYIRRVKPNDAGRWTCKVSNNFGEQRLDIHLFVTAHLNVHILPQLQVINSGESALFNCSVSGSPVQRIQWYRNGEPLSVDESGNVKLLSPLVLAVSEITRHDRGMYQCVVQNDRESAQGSAELRLGDTVPELQYTFIEQAMTPGPQVSLRCSATGSPPPRFRWLLDGELLNDIKFGHRYAISQYVDKTGDVISHLNISNSRVEDGGLYSCRALNSLGSTDHSARLNIYGPPFIRSIGPIKAVASADITLHCPYSGYPINGVKWERRGQELPIDLRHQLVEGGALTISRLDPLIDSGFYTCTVTNREGESARRDIEIIVHSPPVLEPFSFPSSLQEGGRAQVTCYVTSGDLPIHFSWHKDNDPISASLQVEERAAEFYSMLIFKEVSSRHSGAYTCMASNSAARANYTAHLIVKVAPQWLKEPQDVSVLLGHPVLVDCLAKGSPEPQITWLKGQGKISTDYQPLLSFHSRAALLANGSMWLESVSSQDEGHYLCRATNDIGSGLGKVIYVGVNEPARFDLATKNVSTKRATSAVLMCHVYGDNPIEVLWTLNGNRIDMNNYRYTVSNSKTENGMKSVVTISRTDREDSGVYKCLAENAFGRSEHVINLAVQERPDPPSMLEVVEVSSRSVKLAWRRPFDGNSAVIGYLLQYQVLGANPADWDQSAVYNLTIPANPDVNSEHTNTQIQREETAIGGLLPATVYTLRMLAVNNIDQSPFTESIVVKTQEEEPAEAPKDIRVEAVGAGELFLTWLVPPRESWNGELLGYIVTWNEQAQPNQTKSMTVKGWATNKLQLTGLKKFTRYDITLRAFNSISTGPSSPVITGTTKEGVPEAPPQDLLCSEISSQIMKISWSPPQNHYHGGHILGYKIFYRPLSNENDLATTGEVKRTSSTETYLHGLHKYTNYSIKALAYTGAGDGVISHPIICTSEQDLPGPPANIKAAALTGESILVSWLSPAKPNGRISHYTIYYREAGRVGKHTNYNVRVEDMTSHGLNYEVRNLVEHQLYEFWISATTGIGEGEPTAIIAQATNSRAPSRIASFSQTLHKPDKSKLIMPCFAVGNPTPRTRWIHRERPITFSPYFEVTPDGNLKIFSVEQSLAGNYSCSAKNLFGEDEITYTLVVLMPPNSPNLEVQFTTASSIRLHWTQPEDGGAMIQGYTLNMKYDNKDWTSIDLSPEQIIYTLDGLKCGSMFHIYLLAHNRVGKGSPSPIRTVSTKGGPPQVPKEKDFITTNSSTLQLNLYNWPDGGCPILQFSVQYRMYGEKGWNLIARSVSEEKIVVHDLIPSTWYQLKISAENDAGIVSEVFHFATTSLAGEKIPRPPHLGIETQEKGAVKKAYIVGLGILGTVILIVLLWFIFFRRKATSQHESEGANESQDDKTVERDNRRNCQQVYTSSPVKSSDKMLDEASDYTMQFKTFGHIEDEDHNGLYPKSTSSSKHSWQKHRYYNAATTQMKTPRMRPNRMAQSSRGPGGDSGDSDETSGSPCGECPSSSNYRVPVKGGLGERAAAAGYGGYETLLVSDLFRRDSSTESNDVSPMTERRHTPKHVVASTRLHRTSR
ncbi:unnamed protein product [Brassicogethes aeneus]|uniref:Down syndrome cell adhesion molecule-like protein Dscam2 n=1 Tax=Brassicogethes aeneus TaxID=1431903 RepID=A0A9P0BG55_BRAAE|nr:unnamed protein product [Brassicogethes aeneus]